MLWLSWSGPFVVYLSCVQPENQSDTSGLHTDILSFYRKTLPKAVFYAVGFYPHFCLLRYKLFLFKQMGSILEKYLFWGKTLQMAADLEYSIWQWLFYESLYNQHFI